MSSVAIVQSGGANINSVVFAFQRLGVEPELTADESTIRSASHVVLPGVGTAAAAMNTLKSNGLNQWLPELSQPVLGICLGMQLLFERSEEGDTPCLGILGDTVVQLRVAPGVTIPHMGWNANTPVQSHPILQQLPDHFHGYFVHSYAAPIGNDTIARSHHGTPFSSIVAKDNFVGIQFHPERSGAAGAQLLKNFLRM